MKYAALLTLLSFALSCPVMAKPHHFHHRNRDHHYATHDRHHHYATHERHHDAARTSHHADHYTARETAHVSHSGITCEMVRTYVAQVGLSQAMAMAKSAGMSAAEEQRARQCLAKRI